MSTAGFYTTDLRFAPNAVYAPGVTLLKEEKDTYTYPVGGWTWYNSRELAVEAATASGENPSLVEAQRLELLIQEEKLDSLARSLGYDNIYTAVSYAVNRQSPRYDEANRLAVYRDAVWSKAEEIKQAIISGDRTQPTDQELLAELPTFE